MASSRLIGLWPLAFGLLLLGVFTPTIVNNLSFLSSPEIRGQASGECYQYDFQRNGMFRRAVFPWYCTLTLEDGQIITAVTATPRFNLLPKNGDQARVRKQTDGWILTTGLLPEIRLAMRELIPLAFGAFLTGLGLVALRSTPSQTTPTPSTAPKAKRLADPRAKK
jgi:hypothetical protein